MAARADTEAPMTHELRLPSRLWAVAVCHITEFLLKKQHTETHVDIGQSLW